MKVIVAGFPKTGTKSMNAALTKLGYKVYDVVENLALLREEYKKIFHDGWTTEDFRRMYENVDAVVDIPACYFWEEIHKAFPDAKIILTMRENADIWFESLRNQITTEDSRLIFRMMAELSPSFRRIMADVVYVMWRVIFGVTRNRFRRVTYLNPAMLKMKYRAHNAHVLQNSPPDKLLVYSCSEGWEPLCRFLDLPVPSDPFPHKNKRGKWADEALRTNPLVLKLKTELKIMSMVLVASLGAAGGFFLYKRGMVGL